MITSLAWRNIWRQPMRTSLSVVGIAFTSLLLVFMLSFQFGSYDTMKSSMLRVNDGFGQFQPAGYQEDPELSKVIRDPSALLTDARAIAGVSSASPRANGFGLLANGERTFAAAVIGVDPNHEAGISTLSTMVDQGRVLNPQDDAAIVIGDGLARNLKLSVGDAVTLLGAGLDESVAADVLQVVGIFKTGMAEVDRQIARMPLKRFNETFRMDGAVNLIAIAGAQLPAIENAEAELRAIAQRHGVHYLNWGELAPALKQAITLDMSTALLMYAVLVIVVVFIILNTLYMSVLERTREFGVLLAIGMKPYQIGQMVWTEMVLLSSMGAALGIALGMLVTWFFQVYGITIEGMEEAYAQFGLSGTLYPAMTPMRVLAGPLVVVAAIAVMGIIPYRRALGLRPVPAMAS